MPAPRLAVVTTHPVQYYAPLFRALAERGALEVKVFYGWEGAAAQASHDAGFGVSFAWDVPLLEGYDHAFVENVSDDPGPHHPAGIDAPTLVSEVKAFGPDAVLVFGWNYRAHRAVLRAFHGRVPIFFRGDSTLLDECGGVGGTLRRIARRAVLRRVYRDVDVALYVGTRNRAYFEAHGLRPDQLAWAPHAVENSRFADPTGEHAVAAASWRRDLGVSPGERLALFVGKLELNKAPEVLLDAFLRQDAADRLVFCGTGPLERALRDTAAGRSNVHFLGFQNQSRMPVVYRLGDVLVLPSRSETWGLAVNEAMAAGRAVVVSDRVGCAVDLVDDANGRVVPVDDPAALAAALAATMRDADPERLGAASAERIRAWSIGAAAARIETAIVGVVGQGPPFRLRSNGS